MLFEVAKFVEISQTSPKKLIHAGTAEGKYTDKHGVASTTMDIFSTPSDFHPP